MTEEQKQRRREQMRKYYQEHKEEKRKYYQEHREERLAYQNEYYSNHYEEVRAKQNEYYSNHYEEVRAYQNEHKRKHREERLARDYCDQLELVENYYEAKQDNFNGWCIHHRLEIQKEKRLLLTRAELIALDMYWHRPPEELVFMKNSDHMKLHMRFRKGFPPLGFGRRIIN